MNQVINITYLIFKVIYSAIGFIASIITIYLFYKGATNSGIFKNRKEKNKVKKQIKEITINTVDTASEELKNFIKDFIEKEKWCSYENINEKEKESFKKMMGAIKESHKNNTVSFHYANETNMIQEILLGMKPQDFKKLNNLAKTSSIKNKLSDKDLVALKKLEDLNSALISVGIDYNSRKKALKESFDKIIDSIF